MPPARMGENPCANRSGRIGTRDKLLLYAVVFAICAVALAAAAGAITRGSPAAKTSAALLAAAQTPFLMALCALVSAAAAPRNRWLMQWLPVGAAIALLWCAAARRDQLGLGAGRWRAIQMRMPRDPVHWAIGIALTAAVVAVIGRLLAILSANTFPIIANDALIYLSEARVFATRADVTALSHGLGVPGGGLPPAHPHTALFSIYLGHALTFAKWGANGALIDDLPARSAFQLSVACLVLAVAGSAIRVNPPNSPRVGPLAAIAFCLFAPFEYMSFASSRDAFRLIPWLLLVTLLTELAVERRLTPLRHAAAGLAAGLAIASHTVDLYFMVVGAPVVAAAFLIRRVPWRQIGALAVAGVLGSAPALAHYVSAWQKTGNILGNGMNYFYYPGTPLMDAFRRFGGWADSNLPLGQALWRVLRDQGPVWAPASVGIAILLPGVVRVWARRPAVAASVLAALFLTLLVVPLLNFKRFFALDIKDALIANFRYGYTISILAPLVIAGAADATARGASLRCGRLAGALVIIALTAGLAASAGGQLRQWRTYPDWSAPIAYRQTMARICDKVRLLKDGERWLSDRTTIAYQCGIWPIYLYSPEGRRYFVPRSASQARAVLIARNVALVTLEEAIPGWWPSTPFYAALRDLVSEGVFDREDTGTWQVFRRIHDPPRR